MFYDSRIIHLSESSPALPDKLALLINVGRSTFLAARHVSPHEAVFSGLLIRCSCLIIVTLSWKSKFCLRILHLYFQEMHVLHCFSPPSISLIGCCTKVVNIEQKECESKWGHPEHLEKFSINHNHIVSEIVDMCHRKQIRIHQSKRKGILQAKLVGSRRQN